MREDRLKALLTWGGAAFMVVFCLAPFLFMAVTSLSAASDYLSLQGNFHFSLENYRAVLSQRSLHFMEYLWNSLAVSGISAFLGVLIAGSAAYAVTRLSMPGRTVFLMTVLAVSMFPQISLIGYLFRFMARLGWINTWAALIVPYIAWILPLSLWILVSYFARIPKALDEAALIDGCSRWQTLWKVIVPVAAPGLFSCFLLAFIFAFNEFMFALMLTTDFRSRTVLVGIALFQGLHGEIPWGQIMAASAVTTLPVVALTLLFQRKIVQGLTRGAVKE